MLTVTSTLTAVNTYRRYDVRSGLSDNSVKDVCQDATGYMWFATKDGLNRFNGYDFKTFGSSSYGRIHNIEALCPHSDGKHIWLATTNGLCIFDTSTEQISPFTMKADDGAAIPNCLCLQYDTTGDLWIGSFDGIFRYNQEKDTLIHYSVPECSSDRTVRTIFEDSHLDIWAGTINGLTHYDTQKDAFDTPIRLHDSSPSLGDNEITAITQTVEGPLLIGTQNGEIAEYIIEESRFRIFSPESPASLSRIHDISVVSQNLYLIGSDSGLFRFDRKTGRCTIPYEHLKGESIYKLFNDKEGALWIGTYFGGVCYSSPMQDEIKWYYDDDKPGSLNGNAVSQFCEDDKGNIWIATENGGLNYLDIKSNKITDFSSKSHYNLHALSLDGDRLWIGTFSCGLDCMDLRTGNVIRYKNIPNDSTSICSDYIYAIQKTSGGLLYIGTLNGLSIYDGKTGRFAKVPETENSFIDDIMEDGNGNIWIATRGEGLWRNSPDGSWQNYRHDENDALSIIGDRITRIHIDRNGALWFCEEGAGICRYIPEKDGFECYTVEDNLPRSIYYGILDDSTGNLWISSNSGLIRYNPALKTSIRYTTEDGLQSNQFNFRSSLKSKDGVLFFGGINGFNSFHPFNLTLNTTRPNIAISSVSIHKSGSLQESGDCIPIPENGLIKMDHKVVTFDINFESLSFIAPGQNRYMWTMEGANKGWITTDRPSVSFTKLPPGHYTFMVRGSNNDGYWSDRPARVSINILPPPMLSPLAKTIYALIILIAFYAILRTFYQRQKEKKEQELIAAKMTFFTQVAHEIKTPLSLIKAPLEQIIAKGEWDSGTEENLEIMDKNVNRLMKLIRQLLDFRKIDKDGYTLSLNRTDLNRIVEDTAERFRPSNKEITLRTDTPDTPTVCHADSEAITKIISNLLGNAYKYAKKEIVLSLDTDADKVYIKVQDDGPGVPAGMEEKIFEPFYQINPRSGNGFGIGLSLIRLLVEKHEGKIHVDTKGEGCCIVIEIPYITGIELQHDEKAEHEAPASQEDISEDKQCILIVEDTAEMLDFLKKIFMEEYSVLTAKDGKQALMILESRSCDLIISDIMMPEMDGIELLSNVRNNDLLKHIPFILLSAKDNVDTKIEGLEHGADAFVEKPFSIDHIKATVRSLLTTRKLLFEYFASYPDIFHKAKGMSPDDSQWLDRLNMTIRNNLSNDKFSVDTLALEMGICRSSLQRKVKAITGESPNDYVRTIRLKLAANLLKEGKYRVNEVCYICGFNNPSYFAKRFQEQFGVLPSDYR